MKRKQWVCLLPQQAYISSIVEFPKSVGRTPRRSNFFFFAPGWNRSFHSCLCKCNFRLHPQFTIYGVLRDLLAQRLLAYSFSSFRQVAYHYVARTPSSYWFCFRFCGLAIVSISVESPSIDERNNLQTTWKTKSISFFEILHGSDSLASLKSVNAVEVVSNL